MRWKYGRAGVSGKHRDIVRTGDDYTLDYDNWGGTPFMIGVTLITSDSILGRTALEMLASPKWNSGDKYTWVIE